VCTLPNTLAERRWYFSRLFGGHGERITTPWREEDDPLVCYYMRTAEAGRSIKASSLGTVVRPSRYQHDVDYAGAPATVWLPELA